MIFLSRQEEGVEEGLEQKLEEDEEEKQEKQAFPTVYDSDATYLPRYGSRGKLLQYAKQYDVITLPPNAAVVSLPSWMIQFYHSANTLAVTWMSAYRIVNLPSDDFRRFIRGHEFAHVWNGERDHGDIYDFHGEENYQE
ncbi:hypothetical protein HYS48_01395 [Candidatus Woesearchaeota archaeon]|nr:hypothetical protein [Candidatus Woesearchaeota archaeon]